jgi:flagellar biosynthesis GTPase FlhF
MTVKSFRGRTVDEAMAQAQAAYGPAVQVLDRREVAPRGPLHFLRRRLYEVVVGVGDGAPGGGAAPTRAGRRPGGARGAASELEARLLDAGVDRGMAAALVEQSRHLVDRSGSGRPIDRLRKVLIERFETTGESHPSASAGPTAMVLIGPPGSGKTTLVAKLAARFGLGRSQRVALASVDFFRVGAFEQLKAYAEVLGMPCHFAQSPASAARILPAAGTADWLLVDTPGLSSRDAEGVRELGRWLEPFRGAQRHLVLSAATDRAAALAAVETYRTLRYERVAFAQVDEARRHGLLLAAVAAAAVPVSYLSVGQDVSCDIEAATPDRLAALVLGKP